MKILFASSEVYPFAKTGGLADVAGSLPSALSRLGHDVKVVMPWYRFISEEQWGIKKLREFFVRHAGRKEEIVLFTGVLPKTAVEILFVSCEPLSRRSGLYQESGTDYPDNLEGFSLFSRAILEIPKILNWSPDIFHLNDWQTALVPAYLRAYYSKDPYLKQAATLFTIHNLSFQGIFPEHDFPKLDLPPDYFSPDGIEYYGNINLMKAGITYSTILNTVSPTYSREILTPEYGCGLEGLLQKRQNDLYGILNGADYQKWNPAQDRSLSRCYSTKAMEGKTYCKSALQRKCKFPEKNVPLISVVSRLTVQKGIDLVIDLIDELMALDIQLIILGIGHPDMENRFKEAGKKHADKLSIHLTFDEKFAHRVFAGTDIFLMPSRFEPCGLSQLYAMRYGAFPVVRRTGGLADTITDATPLNIRNGLANGLQFESATPASLLNGLRLAIAFYRDPPLWHRMVQAGMTADFSWSRSANDYLRAYRLALGDNN